MKTIERENKTLTGHERQRKLTRQSILRIILVSSFITNLLIVYTLIHPSPASGLVNTVSFASLAPVLRGSVLFFLALSVVSLIGFACLDPETEPVVSITQTDPVAVTEEAPIAEPAQIIVFRPELSPVTVDSQPTLVRK